MTQPEGRAFIPYPMKLSDLFKESVWGNQRLASVLHKRLPANKPIGESWEMADHGEDTNMVTNGPCAGLTIAQLRERHGEELVGAHALAAGNGKTPLLIKFIDANQVLSVQVHPDNAYAAAHHPGELGKTEAWYIISADPGAEIVFGLKPGVDRDALRKAIDDGKVESLLNRVPVRAGECYYTPSGVAHAIGAGVVVYEIQQNSDVTYRFYDWNRLGLDGKPRELHIQQSLDVIDLRPIDDPRCRATTVQERHGTVQRLINSPFFVLDLLEGDHEVESTTAGTGFHVLSAIGGHGEVEALDAGGPDPTTSLSMGETVLLPAALGRYRVGLGSGLRALRGFVPPPTS